jgi:hypothetical protein
MPISRTSRAQHKPNAREILMPKEKLNRAGSSKRLKELVREAGEQGASALLCDEIFSEVPHGG